MLKIVKKSLDELDLYIKEEQFLSSCRTNILNNFESTLNEAIKNYKRKPANNTSFELESILFLERYKSKLISAKEQIEDIKNRIIKINEVNINKNTLPSKLSEIYIFITDKNISDKKIFNMLLIKYNLEDDAMKRDLNEIFMHRNVSYTSDNKPINYQDSDIPPLIKEALKAVE